MDLGSIASGAFWVGDDIDIESLFDELDDDWTTVRLHVTAGATKAAIIDDLGTALEFPSWSARNLDALYDLLTDLDWLEDGHVAIALERTPEARLAGVDGWQQIVQVMIDAAAWWHERPRTFVAILG